MGIGLLLLLAVTSSVLTARVFGQSQQNEIVLRVGSPNYEPNSMNPLTEWNDFYPFSLYYDTLVVYDLNMKVVPRLAESWEVSSDRMTWTFHLVRNATWHDGVPFSSNDVRFTYDFINKSSSYFLPWVKQLSAISTPDEYTVVIQVDKPYSVSYLLEQFPLMVCIMPEHIWSKMTPEQASSSEDHTGTGAFKFVEWKKGQYMEFETNNQWFGKRPVIDKLMLNVYGTNEAMVQALKTGQIDVATRVPPEVVKDLQANPAITVAVKPDLYLNEIAINVYQFGKQNPTLRDKSVRQAMAYAVNKTALLDLVLLGYGQVGDTLVFGPTPWHSTELNLFEFDLAKANAILDEAGYTNRDANGIRESKDGTKLEYTLNVVTDLPKQLRAGEMIRDWWNQIGIKLNVLLTDPGTIASLNLGSTGTEFAHDMFLWSWTGGGNLDPTFQLFIPTSMGIGSVSETGYNDTQYDQLYYQQMVAPDDAQRKQIVDKMQEVVYRDVPYIVLYYPSSIDGWRNDRWENVPEIATGSGGSIVIHAKLPLFVFMITPMTAPAATSTYTAIYLGVALVAASLVVVALYMRKRIKARKS